MTTFRSSGPLLLALALLPWPITVQAGDWTTYRFDAGRSGWTPDSLSADISVAWIHRASAKPSPAWPRSDRMQFDRAFQVVVGGDSLYYGNSADGTVTCLNAATGAERWTFFTEAPVRFAPVIWQDRLFVVSDDGVLYCLRRRDGSLMWKRQGGPSKKSILGNEHLISKWPARGGPVVRDDVVYFAAGIWPSDGIYLYALNAKSGEPVWTNDRCGQIYMAQPHGGANASSGVSAQGYLVASQSHLFLPTGRAVPAVFGRTDGRLAYFHLQKYGHNGGAAIVSIRDHFLNHGLLFRADTGSKTTAVEGGPYATNSEILVSYDQGKLLAKQIVQAEKPDRQGNLKPTLALQSVGEIQQVDGQAAVIGAGDTIIAGGDNRVSLCSLARRQLLAKLSVEGMAYGLAVAGGRLFVSTDKGHIYCFGPSKPAPRVSTNPLKSHPFDRGQMGEVAERIVRETGVNEGYCLDLGCGDGALSYELARRTQLHVVAVDQDPRMVELARRNLKAAGVYGTRVSVFHRPLDDTGFPRYFANLIVSARGSQQQTVPVSMRELRRMQRPFGGVICWGPSTAAKIERRGPLEGAGQWTHQYANAGNTLNSDDSHVKGKLGMLWFRDVDIPIPQRHGRAPAPLFQEGRLFHQGLDGLIAVDAYNGRVLWRYDLPGVLRAYNGDELMGTAGTGSNFCVNQGSVFVRHGDRCLRIDARTGSLVREYAVPGQPNEKKGPWGYISCVDGVLYGTEANPEHVVTYRYINRGGDMNQLLTESSRLFALDVNTGELLWDFRAQHSIRHNAIAIAGGRVFLIDRPLAKFDRKKKPDSSDHPTGILLAKDGKTGKTLWSNDDEIYGTMLAASGKFNAVLMSFQPTNFRLASEFGGKLGVIDSDSGKRLWEKKVNYASRPLLNGRTIYAQGGAWDLMTGEARTFNFSRSYGCGILAGAKNMVLYRSATLGYFDLKANEKTKNYGGIRPGCWVNILPAGGIVLVPDASAGCKCSYLNKSWFALEPLAEAESE